MRSEEVKLLFEKVDAVRAKTAKKLVLLAIKKNFVRERGKQRNQE